ncbi:MAG: class I SAM-dependent methyltransferase [Patescibacteria group bacterium]
MNKTVDNYLKITENNPPSPWLPEAIKILNKKDCALDLGCGSGRDTKYLLEQGFVVTAVDKELESEIYIKKLPQDNLTFILSKFEDFNFEKEKYNLINAQFSLPFIDRDRFNEVFEKIKLSLKTGGVFVGQLFGINDDWNKSKITRTTFHTKEEARRLFEDMKIIRFIEKDYYGKIDDGTPKHWHVFHILSVKD